MKSNVKDFLEDLHKLSDKYDCYIGGCGCCGSPWVMSSEGKELLDNLNWDFESEKYKGDDW